MIKFLCYFVLFSLAFSANLTIDVDKKNINQGDSITLSVVAKNSKNPPELSLSKLNNFQIISGPNQSSNSSYSIVNGKMTSNSSYELTWLLMPNKIGRLVIPSLVVNVDGKVFNSNPIYINVLKRTKKSMKNAQFFIEASINNKTPFRGEQITLTYTLYTRVDVTNFNEKLPVFKGFWVEDLFSPQKLKLRKVQKNNFEYHAATIKKIALFPTKSGLVYIDPMVATISVRDGKRNAFSVFGPPSKQHTISTEPLSLNVKPLPESKDGIISAVVGKWDIKSTVDRNSLLQNEALTIRVYIKGEGNLKSADILPYNFPEKFEVFEPKITMIGSNSQVKIGGEKIIEYVVIPRSSGKILLDPFQIKFFDNELKQWKTKKSNLIQLNVAKNKNSSSDNIGLLKEEVQLVGEDIRFIDESMPNWQNKNIDLLNKYNLILIFILLIVVTSPIIVTKRRLHLDSTISIRKSKKAFQNSIDILKSPNDSAEDVYKSIHIAVIKFINHKTNSNSAEYSKKEIVLFFKKYSADKNICLSLQDILNRGEAVRYGKVSNNDVKNDVENIINILRKADDVWK